ncbi:MAG: flagellar basal body rod protein FlgB [Alphaproteobacteria bacterium]|jgi:flagellar basal-body rod protein FlgB|nr:flagellar basal body rod protein FlgB [Rhodospirillaceae bacterium]MDP6405661.1 flagellar basal body rod protein FlgB [Alphaproteobacteria bacterium]MDP6624748.1 flagellar basal body rod protein FlgB [Alphaproteobacteria bacterium]|tara:strand:+ start:1156 stop:1563 length:408 start_codon:yes stop_codon:yes gene_type:complete
MDLKELPIFAALTKRIHWLNQRQKVLSHNVANADTPNFTPSDIAELRFRDLVGRKSRLEMTATDASHVLKKHGTQAQFEVKKAKDTYEKSPDGNAVVLEEQMLKVAQTRIDYETMTSLYRKHVGMLKMALGRGGR